MRQVKHITFSNKNFIVGDEIADLMMEYAKELADRGRADTVSVAAIGSDGAQVTADFLFNGGTIISSETVDSQLPEPDNSEVEGAIRHRIDALVNPPQVRGEEQGERLSSVDEY